MPSPDGPESSYAQPSMPPHLPPRSVAAIAAFVCSLLGCLGVTAVAGLILGIVGIVQTAGGKRRGLGLSIAAIPISCVTGVLSIVLALGVLAGRDMFRKVALVGEVLKSDASAAVDLIAPASSPSLRSAADEPRVRAWLAAIRQSHGTFIGLAAEGWNMGPSDDPRVQKIVLTGKFVNGTVPVAISISYSLADQYLIEDLSVDGVSLRSANLEGPASQETLPESNEAQPAPTDSPGLPPS